MTQPRPRAKTSHWRRRTTCDLDGGRSRWGESIAVVVTVIVVPGEFARDEGPIRGRVERARREESDGLPEIAVCLESGLVAVVVGPREVERAVREREEPGDLARKVLEMWFCLQPRSRTHALPETLARAEVCPRERHPAEIAAEGDLEDDGRRVVHGRLGVCSGDDGR